MLRKACLDDCLNKASKARRRRRGTGFDFMDIIRKWDEDGVLLRWAQTVMPLWNWRGNSRSGSRLPQAQEPFPPPSSPSGPSGSVGRLAFPKRFAAWGRA